MRKLKIAFFIIYSCLHFIILWNNPVSQAFFQQICQFAAREENKEGFTIDIHDGAIHRFHPQSGYAVAMNLTRNYFGEEGLRKVLDIATNSTFLVGGWLNKNTAKNSKGDNKYHYDCIMYVPDYETANALGKANNQLCIFDFAGNGGKGEAIEVK